jgi:DNA-binding NarL/FixJ family response regulator
MSNSLNILIAEDHKMTARLLQSVLNKQPNMQVVDVLASGKDVVAAMSNVDIDVLLLDLELPIMNGFDIIASLGQAQKDKVLVLSAHTEAEVILRSKELGAKGYMSKRIGMKELVDGIRSVAGGKNYFEYEYSDFEVKKIELVK